MTNFPDPMQAPGPDNMRPPGRIGNTPIPVDTSGLAQGVAALSRGIAQGASGLDDVATRQKQQEDTVDIARAEAFKTKQFYAIQNSFAQDGDYSTFNQRATPMVSDALDKAGGLIRDDRVRERWLAQSEDSKISMLQAVNDKGLALKQDAEKTALIGSMDDNAKLMSDPTVPKVVRDKARSDVLGSIYMGQQTGLLKPSEAATLKKNTVDQADNQLAVNLAETDILSNPQHVMTGMAIPTTGAGGALIDAQTVVDGTPPQLEFSLAKMTAQLMGDANFPDDPKLAAAYLSDPQKAMDYAEAAQTHLSDRYKGDLSAVVIAMDPKGGTALADKWVSSNHDASVLPPEVAQRYGKVMASITAQQPYTRIPIQAAPGVDLSSINPAVLDHYEQLQSHFGMALPVINGDPSKHLGSGAIDIDVSGLNTEQRSKLIEMASSAGFTGIGVGKDDLTFDTGAVRAWGPDGQAESVPGWAKDAVTAHNSGTVQPMPALYSGVAPEYANLTYDQRLVLYSKAKSAMDNQDVGLKSSLQTIADNAPAALAATGKYDGQMPTANDFVKAYGGTEGVQRYQQFETEVDTSKTVFGMRTMSNDDITAAVKGSAPLTSGNTAALDQKRYQVVATAAQSVREARAKDPAGYTLDAFPQVMDAFTAAQKDHTLFPQALTMMAEAQKKLGITDPQLLPKAMAAQAADSFKDATLPAQQRIAAVAGTVLATPDLGQQDAIFKQLVKEGLPNMTAGALDAMRRGDAGAAQTLMRAAVADLSKTELPSGQKDTDIATALQDDVFGTGKIGDIAFGLTSASADNFDMAAGSQELMLRDVKMRLADGSAGGNLDKAVQLATKDVFGDVQVVTGKGGGLLGIGSGVGVKVTLPKDADPNQARAGFNALLPKVHDALVQTMVGPGLPQNAPDGSSLALQWGISNYVDTVMSDGYFTNGDGYLPAGQKGFVFMDPKSASPVTTPDGKPLVFNLNDVLAAAPAAQPSANPNGSAFRK